MSTHITPTVGRIVWYRGADGKTRAAIIAGVHGVFSLNLYVFGLDANDTEHGYKTTVTHADPEIEHGCLPSWHWMPYQIGQAKALDKALEVTVYPNGTIATGTAPLPDVSPTALPPHMQRVMDERDELSTKLGKLLEFTRTITFADLDAPERSRLNRQVQHMTDYRGVLNERIDAFQRGPAKTSGHVELDNIGNDKSNW